MEFYIDKKYTIWERTNYEVDCTEEEFIKMYQNGEEDSYLIDSELVYDTMDSVEANAEPTVEIFNDNSGDLIWDNYNGHTK